MSPAGDAGGMSAVRLVGAVMVVVIDIFSPLPCDDDGKLPTNGHEWTQMGVSTPVIVRVLFGLSNGIFKMVGDGGGGASGLAGMVGGGNAKARRREGVPRI